MSPELLLRTTPGPDGVRISTRPIKGTRPADTPPRELLESEKDTAELAMIVDLMRNDLGRVCRIGSIQVTDGRSIESHPTVHHGVAEIRGVLRSDASMTDLLAATFPPGSVTGAPKVRAMRTIDELEPVRRGPYCGAIGWIGDDGRMTLNVAIRTITCAGVPLGSADELDGRLDYHAGCGIVADSDPESERLESLDKTEVLRRTIERLVR
jgi:para-aminobenzoate synthetase component 1